MGEKKKAEELEYINKQHQCDQKALYACQKELESVSQSLLSVNKELDQAEDLAKVRLNDVEKLEYENKMQLRKTQEVAQQFKMCQDKMKSMEKSISKLEKGCDEGYKKLKAEVGEKEKLLNNAKLNIENLKSEKRAITEKLEERRKALKTKDILQKELEIENAKIKKEIVNARTEVEESFNELKKSNENKEKLLKEQANEIEKLKDDYERSSNDLKTARIKLKVTEENLSYKKKHLEDAKASIQMLTKESEGKLNELKASMNTMESFNSTLSMKVKLSQEKLKNVKTEASILQKNYMLEKDARQQLEAGMSKAVNKLEGKEKDLSAKQNEIKELKELVAINTALQLLTETTENEKRKFEEYLEEQTKILSAKDKDIEELKEVVKVSKATIDSIQKELSLSTEALQQCKETAEIEKCKFLEDLEGKEKELNKKSAEIKEFNENINTMQKKLSSAVEALQQSEDSAEVEKYKFVKDFEEKEKELKNIVNLNRTKIASIEEELDMKKTAEVEKCKVARDLKEKENELTIKNNEIQELNRIVVLNEEKISSIQDELSSSVEALQHSKVALESKMEDYKQKCGELEQECFSKSNAMKTKNEVIEKLRQEIQNFTDECEEYKKKYANKQQLYEDSASRNESLLETLMAKDAEFEVKQGEIQSLKTEKEADVVEIKNLREALAEAKLVFERSKEEYASNISRLEFNLKEMKVRSAQLIKSFKETKRNDEMDIYNLNKDANEAKSSFEDTKETLLNKISHLENNLYEMKQVVTILNTEKSNIQRECEEKVKEISLQGTRICELVDSINKKGKEIESLKHELSEVKVSYEILTEEKAHCTKMYEEAENEGITLAMDVKTLSQKLEGAENEVALNESKIKYLEEKIEADKEFIINLKNEGKTANDLLEEVSHEANGDRKLSEAKICALEGEIRNMSETQKESEKKMDDMKSKLLMLQEELMENSKLLDLKMVEIDALK